MYSFLYHITLLALMVLMVHGATSSTTNAQEPAADTTVEITDAKLRSINIAIESLEYWVEKMAAGDSRRATSLLRDQEKIGVRLARIPASEDDQYQFVLRRLAAVKQAIVGKADGSGTTIAGGPPVQNSTPQSAPANPQLASIELRLKNLEQDIAGYDQGNQRLRSRVRGDLESLQKSFDRIPGSQHPQYVQLAKRIKDAA